MDFSATFRTAPACAGAFALALALGSLGCGRRAEPPGARLVADAAPRLVGSALPSDSASKKAAAEAPRDGSPASPDDHLPFDPTGQRLVSIAWRTWIYTDTGRNRTRYGYLRAGAVVDARGPSLVNEGCEGGWYRVNPRGFVCLGLGATLDLNAPVAVASSTRAVRGRGLPYVYALSDERPPLLYFKLPTAAQMNDSEGGDVRVRSANFQQRARVTGVSAGFGDVSAPPAFLALGQKLTKPYGVKQPLRFGYHAGPAAPDSGFAISRVFEWEKRWFGLTTELDVIALDRTRVVRPSRFHGLALAADEGLPVGFATDGASQRYQRDAEGRLVAGARLGDREGIVLSGQSRPGGFLEARDGTWVAGTALRLVPVRESFPSFATGDRKWIDISIRNQTLVAYSGRIPVYVTLISSGRAGLGDPETTESTPRGTFMIYQKEVSSTMDGDEDRGDSYSLRDVPFVQYFHKGYALHAAYWHDQFGKVRSHGCVNLAAEDAAWLFEWTDPSVPKDWHGVLNKERGTVVHIHP